MKITNSIAAALAIIIVVFLVNVYFQALIQDEIALLSEYHTSMSLPAISLLDNTLNSFERMYLEVHEIVSKNEIQFEHEEYLIHKNTAFYLLGEYSLLAKATDSSGNFLADPIMQENMIIFSQNLKESIMRFDRHSQELFSSIQEDFPESEQIILFNSLEEEAESFRAILYDDKKMELNGAQTQQNKLEELERLGEYLFSVFSAAEIAMMFIIILFLTSTLKRNIEKLTKIAKDISTKNLNAKITFKEKNEFTPLADNIAIMQEKLLNSQGIILRTQKLATIGELASRLSHDLRNPLSVIKNSTEIIDYRLKDQMDETSKQQIEFTQRAINRMTHQIDHVLDFVKIRSLIIADSDICKTITTSIQDLNIPKNIQMYIPKEVINVECDHYLLEIVFKNLIWNSVQSIEKEGQIEIKCEKMNSNVMIELKDTGSGISDENLNKIFDPLFTTKQHGTGLGLPSCKSIIESHNGRIFAKNNPTRFFIELPMKHEDSIESVPRFHEKTI